MWMSSCVLLNLLLAVTSRKEDEAYHISRYEYGAPTETDMVSLVLKGIIPAFEPFYTIKLVPQVPLSKTITYLFMEYISTVSKVIVEFDPKESILVFYIKFPFVKIPYGIIGFSSLLDVKHKIPLDADEEWTQRFEKFREVKDRFLPSLRMH